MDELDIAGRQYISTRRAGKEHGYHSDYIGQLIRGGKVAGQKVGRAWYVDAQSLAEYLGKPYITPKKDVAEVAESVVQSAHMLDKISDEAVSAAQTPVAQTIEEKVEAPVVAAPVVEKIAEPAVVHEPKPAIEERAVPIHVTQPVSHVTLVEEKNDTPSGLIYIPDDAPSLPHVHTMQSQNRAPVAEMPTAYIPQKSGAVAKMTALVSVVGIAIVLGIGIAAYVSSGVKVSGETANAYYAIGH